MLCLVDLSRAVSRKLKWKIPPWFPSSNKDYSIDDESATSRISDWGRWWSSQPQLMGCEQLEVTLLRSQMKFFWGLSWMGPLCTSVPVSMARKLRRDAAISFNQNQTLVL